MTPPPFDDHQDLCDTIDPTPLSSVPWESFTINYQGSPEHDVPAWMDADYAVTFCNARDLVIDSLQNPDFANELDFTPYEEYDTRTGERQFPDFFPVEWVSKKADEIAETILHSEGCLSVPSILGSKITVSVATGHNEHYPFYHSIGNIFNTTRRAHVTLNAFLCIPKCMCSPGIYNEPLNQAVSSALRKHQNDTTFRKFRGQLFHSSMTKVFSRLRTRSLDHVIPDCMAGSSLVLSDLPLCPVPKSTI
ncbi:hypothetical protein HGRIS_001207 [Hohenbuehelia grisea]|uniref:Uncharacterized protein n=1 Tax=Hohenbuehelia grisea TaxID=104357 RepID=A0ABR3JNT1_9AGAR